MNMHYQKSNLLLEFGQDISNVAWGAQTDHNVQLFQFDVDRIVVFHKKHFDFFLENLWTVVQVIKNNSRKGSV